MLVTLDTATLPDELEIKALDAVKSSDRILQSGAWYTMVFDEGTTEKFQATKWVEKMQNEKFRQQVYQIMDDEVIMKFDKRQGNASDFYDSEEEAD